MPSRNLPARRKKLDGLFDQTKIKVARQRGREKRNKRFIAATTLLYPVIPPLGNIAIAITSIRAAESIYSKRLIASQLIKACAGRPRITKYFARVAEKEGTKNLARELNDLSHLERLKLRVMVKHSDNPKKMEQELKKLRTEIKRKTKKLRSTLYYNP